MLANDVKFTINRTLLVLWYKIADWIEVLGFVIGRIWPGFVGGYHNTGSWSLRRETEQGSKYRTIRNVQSDRVRVMPIWGRLYSEGIHVCTALPVWSHLVVQCSRFLSSLLRNWWGSMPVDSSPRWTWLPCSRTQYSRVQLFNFLYVIIIIY